MAKSFKPVYPPKAVANNFYRDLLQVVNAVNVEVKKLTVELKKQESNYVRDDWIDDINNAIVATKQPFLSDEFALQATKIADKFVKAAIKKNAKDSKKNFGIDILTGSPELKEYQELAANSAASLIKSIAAQNLDKVETIVLTNIQNGNRSSEIVSDLQEQFGVTKNRAKLIARDQTIKINSDLSQMRQRKAGFKYFKWLTSKDERVRPEHVKISKDNVGYGVGVYMYDDPPQNKKGEEIMPGDEVNCRCVAVPVLESQIKTTGK